jgi:hypothetical protein
MGKGNPSLHSTPKNSTTPDSTNAALDLLMQAIMEGQGGGMPDAQSMGAYA